MGLLEVLYIKQDNFKVNIILPMNQFVLIDL